MPIKKALESFVLTPKTTMFIRAFCALVILFSVESHASCVREDVTFYLKQGFNHEQIVQLCATQNVTPQQPSYSSIKKPQQKTLSSQPEKLQPETSPYVDKAPIYRHEASGIYGNPDAVFLATAVEAYDVEVNEEAIMFTRKDCVDYGQEDWNEFKDRACPNVKYSITRGGLKIVDRDNGFFGMGSTALYISGTIKAEILDLDQFKSKHQTVIKRIIQKNTEKLKIDVRSGMPQSKVEAVLLRLAG